MKAILIGLLILVGVVVQVALFFLFARLLWQMRRRGEGSAGTARPVMIVVGGIFLLVGCGFGIYSGYLAATGVRSSGVVVGYDERVGKEGGTTYAPVFTFSNQIGERIEVTSTMSSSTRQFSMGAKIPVIYRGSEPYSARPETFEHNWLFPLIFGGVGIVVFAVGVTLPFWRALLRL